ncbi:hypothetical protein ABTB54_19010, partial [Acinetobacter baumannii]
MKHQAISVRTGEGMEALLAAIAARARDAGGNASEPAISRVRHRRAIEQGLGHLRTYLREADKPLELRAEDLRLAA